MRKVILLLGLLGLSGHAAPNCRTLVSIRVDHNLMTGTLHSHFKSCDSAGKKTVEIELWRALVPPKRLTVTLDVHNKYLRSIAAAKDELEKVTAKKQSQCNHPIRVAFPEVKKEFLCCGGDPSLLVAQALDDMIFTLAER